MPDPELLPPPPAKNKQIEDELLPPPPKKKGKGDSNNGATTLEAGSSVTPNPETEIPLVSLEDNETANPIDLASQYNELKNKTVEGVQGGSTYAMGSTSAIPDENSIKKANDLKEFLKINRGLDADALYNETKDFPKEAYDLKFQQEDGSVAQPYTKDALIKIRGKNRVLYEDLISGVKTQFKIAEKTGSWDLANKFIALKKNSKSIDEFVDNVQRQKEIINTVFDNKDEIKAANERLKTQSYIISPKTPGFAESYQNSGLSQKVSPFEYAGLLTLKAFEPEKYEQTLSFINNPIKEQYTHQLPTSVTKNMQSPVAISTSIESPEKNINGSVGKLSQQTVDEKIGMENRMRELAQIGRDNLYQSAEKNNAELREQIDSLPDGDETKNQLIEQYNQNINAVNGTSEDAVNDDKKYPLTAQLKFDKQTADIIGKEPSILKNAAVEFAMQADNPRKAFYNLFGDSPSLQRQMVGQSESLQNELYLPEEFRRNNSPLIPVYPKDVEDEIKKISKDKNLSFAEKKAKSDAILLANQDRIKTITNPNEGATKNFFSKATAHTMASFMSSILGMGFAMAGNPIKGKVGEMLSMGALVHNDAYTEAVNKGYKNANEYANLHTGIVIMATQFGTQFDLVRKLVKSNPATASAMNGITQDVWDKVVSKNANKIANLKKSFGAALKDNSKMVALWGGVVPAVQSAANNAFYNEGKPASEIAAESYNAMKDMAIGQLPLAIAHFGKGYIGESNLRKSLLWEIGDNADLQIQRIKDQAAQGLLTPEQATKNTATVKEINGLINEIPIRDKKGKLLTDEAKADYLYNLYVKSKAKKSTGLPEEIKKDAEHKAMVADGKMDIIISDPTDKQLESQQSSLEKKLEPKKDAEGKAIELPEKEKASLEAELEAVKQTIEARQKEVPETEPSSSTTVSGGEAGSVGVGGDVGVLKDGNGNVMGKGESKIIEVSPDGKQVKVDNVNGWHPIELFEVDRVKSTSNKLENLSEKDFDKLTPSQKVSLYKEHGITKEDGSPITEKDIENSPLQYSYDFMASSESGKWNSANSELESLVKDHRKAYSLYKMLIGDNFAGDNNTFKDIVDYINNKTDANIEYTDRMRRADETMSAEERQAAVDSYNKSAEGKTEDKVQKEKDILEEHGLADETEYSPHELVEKFPLKGVQKVIWDIIKPIVEKLGIKVKFSSSRITEGFDGSNNPMNGEILLRPSTLKNGRLGEVLVHEVVHSLTTKIISRVNSGVETGLTGKQVAAVKGLNKLYKSIEADNNLQNKYPVKDIFEFIAHLTNDSFVKELESKDRNFIQKVVDYISDILGLSNANELAKKYLKDIIHDGTFLEKEGITVVSSDYAANVKGAEGLTPKQRLLEAIKNNSKTTAEKYHDLKSKGKENDFTKAVEQSLKAEDKAPVNKPEGKSDVVDKASNVGVVEGSGGVGGENKFKGWYDRLNEIRNGSRDEKAAIAAKKLATEIFEDKQFLLSLPSDKRTVDGIYSLMSGRGELIDALNSEAKAVEQSLKAEDKAPVTKPEGKSDVVVDEGVVSYEDAIKITPTSELSNPEKYGTDELGMEAKTAALRDEEKTPPTFTDHKIGTYAKDKYGDLYQLQSVPIDRIVLPEGEQKREATVDKYKKWYNEGSKFPPAKGVENFAVYKGKVVVNDGHHRVVAAKQLGLKEVPVWVSLTDPKNPARPIKEIEYHKQISKEQSLSTKPEIATEVKEGFTEAKDLNKIYADLKAKYGDKKGAAIYEVANRLVNPNENAIVEIRGNGVVVKEGGKYILKPFGNTDANIKKWTLYKGMDISDQFPTENKTQNEPIKEGAESTQSIPTEEVKSSTTVSSGVENYDGIFSKEASSISNKGKGTKELLRPSENRKVVMMSPDEYLTLVREGVNKNIISILKSHTNVDNELVKKHEQKIADKLDENINEGSKSIIKDAISKGDKLDMPFVFFDKNGKMLDQDGRNRAAYAKEIGEKQIPVLIENNPLEKSENNPIQNEPIKEGAESTQPITAETKVNAEASPVENIEPAATGEEKVTGVKKSITDATRAANGLPKIELPKMTSDIEALDEAKKRVDSGEVNPQEMVNRILADKGNYKNEGEVMDMQYYAHQLERRNKELSQQLAEAKTPEEEADVRGQKLQLSDLMDAQTEAARTAGNQWGKTGNRMQPVINDAGQIFRDDKATIKEAYGGEVPADVKVKLDAITKERDDAIAAKEKVEEQLRQKMAERGFEQFKEEARKQKKRNETKEALKKEADDLLKELKDEIKGKNSDVQRQGGLPLSDKAIVLVGKLAVNYIKQGAVGLEALVDKLYENVKDDLSGISRKQIKDIIANYEPAQAQKEIERLTKKAQILEDKLTPPSVKTKGDKFTPSEPTDFAKPSKEAKVFRTNNEWVKANQRVANAEFRMKIEKRKAFESQKNWYQRGLAWAGRLTRLSVLSGYNVLGKLAAAATIGAAGKRIPEQAIGAVYSTIFKGIAEKAPIEGFLNAKSEAKWYKEFFNPKKFAKNAWDILKTGSTDLGRRLGSAEYEHVPGLYVPTDLHQIIKDPVKRATFEASFRNGMIWAEKNGLDINDPLVINSLENAAYKRAQYEIFQEQNWLSKKFTSYKSSLEKAGNMGATGKFLVDFMIPVSTVPANIVRRVTTTSPLGLIRGGKEVVDAYRKGIEKLTPDEADHVMKQLKQGTLGTALWLLGWYGYQSFGGLYSQFNPNKKREEGDKVSDVMVIDGKEIPKPAQHALPLEVIQMAATARRIYENYKENRNAETPKALAMAGLGAIGAGLEQIPVIETPIHAITATKDPIEAEKLTEDIGRRFKPQILRETGVIGKKEATRATEFLSTKKLKIVDPHKENLHPVDENGEKIKITDEIFENYKAKREEKIQQEVNDLMDKGKLLYVNEEGKLINKSLDEATEKEIQGWLMNKSSKATKEATEELFGRQPEKQSKEYF